MGQQKKLSNAERLATIQLEDELARIEADRVTYQQHLDGIGKRIEEAKSRHATRVTKLMRDAELIEANEHVEGFVVDGTKVIAVDIVTDSDLAERAVKAAKAKVDQA
jgi:ketosteroid isomerase-like protein